MIEKLIIVLVLFSNTISSKPEKGIDILFVISDRVSTFKKYNDIYIREQGLTKIGISESDTVIGNIKIQSIQNTDEIEKFCRN